MAARVTTILWVELYFIVFLCAAAIAVGPLSLCSVLRPHSESVAIWFQRSGAITAIFAAFAQYRLGAFFEAIRGSTFAESWSLYHMFKGHHQAVSWALAVIAIWGAFVWGYGDLLVNHV